MAAEKTMLGVALRRRIVSAVNGLGRGERIQVTFKGTRAYTNGKMIVLPGIKDLAEIPYSTARALIGYAIHEVAHIRYTDFEALLRAIESGKMSYDALIKKFENCIEDYRIEREITADLRGSASDLTALRNRIHPKVNQLKPEWLADPRACGPLALTWTGSQINGFPISGIQDTLDAIAPGVMKLILNWTDRMRDVASTEEAVDLAIAFTAEAKAYAHATQNAAQQSQNSGDPADRDDQDTDNQETDSEQSSDEQSDSDASDDRQNADADPDKAGDEPDTNSDNKSDGDEQDSSDKSDTASDDSDKSDPGDAADGQDSESQPDGGDATDDDGNCSDAGDKPDDQAAGSPSDAPAPQTGADGKPQNAGQPTSGTGTPSLNGKPGESGEDGADSVDFDTRGKSDGAEVSPSPNAKPSNDGKVDMNNGLTDTYDDQADQATSDDQGGQKGSHFTDDNEPADDASNDAGNASGAPADGTGDPAGDPATTGDGAPGAPTPGDAAENDGRDPFADVLEDNAAFDDLLDDLREYIADQGALPDQAPDATDGEVDPTQVVGDIAQANKAAPNYTSQDPDGDQAGDQDGRGKSASKNHYNDARFHPVEATDDAGEIFHNLRASAAGAISTTARTIKRLLMAEDRSGQLRNRRSGNFDIRNMGAIIRNTGTCYKTAWSKPSPRTRLCLLADFSGSMSGAPLDLAMMGALAIEQATRGTQVDTGVYGYTGYSPHVDLFVFKDGKQSTITTTRRMGAYLSVPMNCTPTGEAMAALAEHMDESDADRRVMVVLTDGTADDQTLCADVSRLLIRRGIEVVAIGIDCESVKDWAPVFHIIHNISELPQALLSTIDPRAHKQRMRQAA